MKNFFLATVTLFAIIFEASILARPITAAVIVLLSSSNFNNILVWATLGGFVLDLLLVRPVGLTSIFLVSILSIIILYKRKVSISSHFFVIPAVFLATLFYSLLFYKEPINSFYWAITITFLVAFIVFFRHFLDLR